MFGQIAINEFNSQRGFTDENGEDVDWVEYLTTQIVLFRSKGFTSDNPIIWTNGSFPSLGWPARAHYHLCLGRKI